ncbi:ATP-binding protein [Actinosynnema sp. CS-041913]|uniref:ATP-binding protein n=1 Tax=Actinosynnema sp. CS-041913 TaxID=3239917 RepID=UPI003D922F52
MDEFVGRQTELCVLQSALERARQGSGRLITVTGPGGVGKTRYCEEGADRARAAGFAVVWGRCWTDGGAPALWPWHSILADLCGGDAAALLDGDAGIDTVDLQRFSRFGAVREKLARACAGRPTVLVVDDVHAADPGTLLLTRFVARSLHRLPLVVLTTCRPGEARPDSAPLLSDLDREGVPVVLGSFDLDETRAFLAGHGIDRSDPARIEALHAVAGGNPLVLRRLLALRPAGRGAGLPDGLTAMVDESLRPLRPTTVRLLTATAVLGMSVPVADAALMVGAAEPEVRDALREAAGTGLVRPASPDSFVFGHDLVRQALADRLTPDRRHAAHARAAEIIRVDADRDSHEKLGRVAHHAVNAAPRSVADARAAVAACRDAARSMVRHFAYEQAVTLLATAAGLHRTADLGPVPARLLLDWAYAVHLCGRLAEAGPLFDRAATAARDERDPVRFAEAALGLGGMWVNEHRDRVERARVVAVQREALAHLPAGHPLLRCRLATRLAAELVRAGGPIGGLLAALEQARRTGDPRVLAEALSLCHQALLAPEHAGTRLDLADELISVASAAGLEVVTLVGVCWRTVDLYHLGDPRAERSLTELRHRSDLLTCDSVRYVQAAMEVMRLIRAGELTRAEEQAERCVRLGVQVGDPDARHCHGAQLMTIGWLRGDVTELVDLAERTAALPTLPDGELVFDATLALITAEAGRHDRARYALHRVTARGLAAGGSSSTWLGCLFDVVEAAAALAEPDIARQAYELLAPFADRPITPSMAVVCFGSAERSLGLAALTFGEVETAVAHLDRAVTANIRLANRPLTACARADLAEALRRRGGPGDRARAAELLDLAIADATAMGMAARAARWARRRSPTLAVRRAGDRWLLVHHDRETLVDDLIGMRHLARLIAHPGVEFSALDLTGGDLADGSRPPEPADHTVLDGTARAAYTRRARELAEEMADARRSADLARVARLAPELDALTAEIERNTGLNGRPRHFTGPAERARTAVRKAISRAIDAIATADPAAAELLRATVTTGHHCGYRPR